MVKTNNKKIGIDFHGVINANPKFFKQFIDIAISQNIDIHIISGGPKDTIIQYLTEHQIKYTALWSIYDHYEKSKNIEFFADGSFHVDDKLWNTAKAEYCLSQNICIHIDDSPIYGNYFKSDYCYYNEATQTCQIGDTTIDFSQNPQDALNKLLALCNAKTN